MSAALEPEPVYPQDAYAWSVEQAAALRRLRASGLPLPNDLDLPMIIEEIESVGSEQILAVESNLVQALLHLLKLALVPDHEAIRHFTKETRGFLLNARRRYRPSMRRVVDLDGVWRDVRQLAGDEFILLVAAAPMLPQACPIGLDALMDREVGPATLAAPLAAALTLPPA